MMTMGHDRFLAVRFFTSFLSSVPGLDKASGCTNDDVSFVPVNSVA